MKSHYIFATCVFFLFSYSILLSQTENEIYKIVEEMPLYGECQNELGHAEKKLCSDKSILSFLSDNIIYPEQARLNKTEGIVVVKVIIDETGTISDSEIIKDIGDGCGDEALRVIRTMGKWKPGQQKGVLVKVEQYIPVKFRVIPLTIKSERFIRLSDLFCENYLTEFIKTTKVREMADGDWVASNICGVDGLENKLEYLKVTITQNGSSKSLESKDGNFTDGMRNYLRNATKGDVIELDYNIKIKKENVGEFSKGIYKSLIVE